jgi:hypothetical protein
MNTIPQLKKRKAGKKMNREEGLRAIINPQLSDRLYILSAEYSVSAELLINLAVKRSGCETVS